MSLEYSGYRTLTTADLFHFLAVLVGWLTYVAPRVARQTSMTDRNSHVLMFLLLWLGFSCLPLAKGSQLLNKQARRKPLHLCGHSFVISMRGESHCIFVVKAGRSVSFCHLFVQNLKHYQKGNGYCKWVTLCWSHSGKLTNRPKTILNWDTHLHIPSCLSASYPPGEAMEG